MSKLRLSITASLDGYVAVSAYSRGSTAGRSSSSRSGQSMHPASHTSSTRSANAFDRPRVIPHGP